MLWEVEGRLRGSWMRKEGAARGVERERGVAAPKCMSGGTDCEVSRSMGPTAWAVTGMSTSEAGRTDLQILSWLYR